MNKTHFILTAALAAATFGTGVYAQTAAGTPTPPPQAAPTPAPNEVIYLPKLPTATELVNAASSSRGVAIQKIDQTSTQITVVYRFDSGQVNTVSYQLIGGIDSSAAPVASANGVPTPSTAAPTVVYTAYPAPQYYPYSYGPYPGYYWPGWVAPFAIGLDFGFRGGYHHRW